MNKNFSDCVILFGGSSEERLVSVASAQNLSKQIPEAKLWFMARTGSVHEVDHQDLVQHARPFTDTFVPAAPIIYGSLEQGLGDLKGKTIILALHGTEGEDGKIQKLFEAANIPFTGTGSKSSALAFDKIETKKIARANNIPVVADLRIEQFNEEEVESLRLFYRKHGKMVLKPFANGSSVGLFIVETSQDLETSIKTIKEKNLYNYIAEPFITGREITVGVREKNGILSALPCSEVRVIQGRQFDYEGKYLGSGVEEITPAHLKPEEMKACQDLAVKTHSAIGCRGYSRTDMILTPNGPILLEINTLPGLSKASFIPQQLTANGETLRSFFEEQINL